MMDNHHSDIDWERRAKAAEKTVVVLKRKVRELYNEGAQTAIHKQLEWVRQRQEKNRQRQEVLQLQAADLERYNKELASEVERRTRELRTILDHVSFGFLLIGPDLKVAKGWTASCHALLDTAEDITGVDLSALLKFDGENAMMHYELAIEEIFDDFMPESLTVGQTPKRHAIGERVLWVEPSVIRDPSDGRVVSVLMTISDITQLEAARNENQLNKTLLSLIRQRQSFLVSLAETRSHLTSARSVIDKQALVRRAVHTVKGNMAIYGLSDTAAHIHAIESRVKIAEQELDEIDRSIQGFLSSHSDILDIDYDHLEAPLAQVEHEDLVKLRALMAQVSEPALKRDFFHWYEEVRLQPFGNLLGPVHQLVENLAQRLDKPVEFVLEGHDTPANPDVVAPIIQVLGHLIRNALDHGIECPTMRGDKPMTGRIGLSFEEHGPDYRIKVTDDGGGIDTDALVKKAISAGFITAKRAKDMDEDARLTLIFADTLSTAETTTDISGRGFGMTAVRQQVEAQNGTLSVHSVPDEGTSITLSFPRAPLSSQSISLAS